MRLLTTIAAVCAAMVAVSCGGSVFSGSGGQPTRLGSLSFEVPVDWKRTDSTFDGGMTSVWTPDPSANSRKESVTAIRSVPSTQRGKPAPAMIDRLLAGAQGTLRGAKTSPVTSITTDQGLTGRWIDVSFQPSTSSQRYRRIHVVLVDADPSALVHVLYTAATPDEGLDAFHLVLDSIRRQEG